jgi:two-component system chemotaxis response regulator CheY
MVVEDETLLLQAITKKLKLSNLDVVSCASGEQALDYLNSLDELPEAVWLDYYLKDMNGLAFMQKLKDDPRWSAMPVVVVSNSASPEKVHNMLALGAKKYILKAEFRLDEIIGMIRELIQDSKDVAAEHKAGAVPAGAAAASPAPSTPVPDMSAMFPPSQPPAQNPGA